MIQSKDYPTENVDDWGQLECEIFYEYKANEILNKIKEEYKNDNKV